MTTRFDLYALPDSFPALGAPSQDPLQRASGIERAIAHDLQEPHRQRRIRPYLSVHELEARKALQSCPGSCRRGTFRLSYGIEAGPSS